MAQKLSRTSSGRRHLRWGSQILANLRAHQEHNYLLTASQKSALSAEEPKLALLVAALGDAVTPYRAFVEEGYTATRAAQTVGDYLCDEAQKNADAAVRPRRKEIEAALKGGGGFAAIFSHKPLSRVLRAGREATYAMAHMAGMILASVPASILDTGATSSALLKAGDLLKSFVQHEKDAIDPKRVPLKLAVTTAVFNLREGLEQIEGRLRTDFSEAFLDSLYPELKKGGTAIAGDEADDEPSDPGATPPPA